MDQEQLDKLLANTYTKSQLLRRVRVLKDFVSFRLFNLTPEQSNLPIDKQIELFLALHQKDVIELDLLRQEGNWLQSLGENFFKQFNLTTYQKIFQNFENYAKEIEPIIVYMPMELQQKDATTLGNWFKTNLDKLRLYELKFDPSLIGGCALSFKGIYKDYSLKARIQENRERILESLKSFRK